MRKRKACSVDPFSGPDHSHWPAGAFSPHDVIVDHGRAVRIIPLVRGEEAYRTAHEPLPLPYGTWQSRETGENEEGQLLFEHWSALVAGVYCRSLVSGMAWHRTPLG